MPEPGTVCEVDYKPWSNVTWSMVAKEIGWPLPNGKADETGSSVVARMIRTKF